MSLGWFIAIAACLGGVLLTFVISVFTGLAVGDIRGWLPHVSRRLVASAARHLPPEMADREEEFRADVGEYEDRPLTMLIVALRIWRDGRAIGRESRRLLGAEPTPGGVARRRPVAAARRAFALAAQWTMVARAFRRADTPKWARERAGRSRKVEDVDEMFRVVLRNLAMDRLESAAGRLMTISCAAVAITSLLGLLGFFAASVAGTLGVLFGALLLRAISGRRR